MRTSIAPTTSSGCRRARWSHLRANARQPGIGKIIDDAMLEIEKVNPGRKGVPFPERFAALQATLEEFAESARLTEVIRERLADVIVSTE